MRASVWLVLLASGALLVVSRAVSAVGGAAPSTASSVAPLSGSPGEGGGAAATAATLALSTLASEDLACVTAGVLTAEGRLGFWTAALACFLGIYVGDLMLFFAGRWLGRRVVRRAPIRWFVKEADVERCSRWLERRGAVVILISRFVPGTRLPTYFAAGLLETNAWWFSLYFLAATALWAPALVGTSMLLGGEVLRSALTLGSGSALEIIAAVVVAYGVLKVAVELASRRGRRLLGARLRRAARWEFWPPWIFYPPVICHIALLALRHRSLTVFTAANPGIEDGGFVGESKAVILAGLAEAGESVARWTVVQGSLDPEARAERARAFKAEHGLGFPLVLKPDVGQRGEGVTIARSEVELEGYFARTTTDTIVQEHVPGVEFGVFYYRFPGETRGRIFSITDKQFPSVTGDGRRTLEELVLDDPRAVLMARTYFERHADRLWEVPAEGETVRLVDIGTHCRGALFLDGGWVATEALREEIDRISRSFEGFFFGRYDLRGPSIESFQRGEGIKVVELNGVTSEATHIYDPKNGLLEAYRVVFEQWRLAFAIGAANRALGARPTPPSTLAQRAFAFLAP
jgi:membrane protein DedA with SNARE-associated domain